MKRFAYSFLLIFIMSCGSYSSKPNSVITIQFHDLGTKRYFLLSMRDSSMLVSPIDSILDFSSVEKISFSQIARVRKVRSTASSGTFVGAGIGLAAGAVVSNYVIRNEGADGQAGFFYRIAFAELSGVAGALIGCVASGDEITYDLTVPTDRESLKQFPLFHEGEPPQLQKII